MTKKKRGRPTKLDSELTERFCTLLSQGNYATVVADAVGISESTYYAWLQRGEDDLAAGKESQYSDFLESIKKSENEAEMRVVEKLSIHMEKNWQCCMTFLERRFPDRWSRGERRDISMNAVSGIGKRADFSRLNDDELALLTMLSAKLEGVDHVISDEAGAEAAGRFRETLLELSETEH